MSEKHEPSSEEQDVEAHASRANEVEEQAQPADDEDDVQAHIKFN